MLQAHVFATLVDWVVVELDALGTDALPALRTFAQRIFDGGDQEIFQTSAIRAEMNAKVSERVWQVVVAALPRPGEQRCLSLLFSTFISLVRDTKVHRPLSFLIVSFLTDVGSAQLRGCGTADSFRTDGAARAL